MKLPKELQSKKKKKVIKTRFNYGKINVIERLASIHKELDKEAENKTIKQLINVNKMAFTMLIVSVMDCKISSENKKTFVALNTIQDWLDKIDKITKLDSRETMLEYYMDLDEPDKTILESIYERLIFDFGKEGELKAKITKYFASIHQKAKETRYKN